MGKGNVYIVAYGDHVSEYKTSSWADCARYIKYCLDNGYRVKSVSTEME